MNKIFIVLLLSGFNCLAQADIDSTTFNNLVKISELYTENVNCTGSGFKENVEALRPPQLEHMVNTLLLLGDGDKDLLTENYLGRPVELELKMWYVLREVHYNRKIEGRKKLPAREIAREVLQQEIDERLLLDNYYYRIQSGIAKLFNNKNLKRTDIDLNSLGLKNDYEKATAFFHITEAMIQRFKVLQMLKKPEKLLEFAGKLPTINGKSYYHYMAFDFEDFDYTPADSLVSYKTENIGSFYEYLFAHFWALAEAGKRDEAKKIYQDSILTKPAYFKYSGMKKTLEELYTTYQNKDHQ